jgi:endonuclease/exonuclease/phosphatase family metal-dependent hydrolase
MFSYFFPEKKQLKLNVYSWNVLHIIHELNHASNSSHILNKYKDKEDTRLFDMLSIISKYLVDTNSIICLQEVPSEFTNMLETYIKTNSLKFDVHTYTYPRNPILKNQKLKDPYNLLGENLVTILPQEYKVKHKETLQFEDKGKACLVLSTSYFAILNVHMPFGKQSQIAISMIEDCLSNKLKQEFILCGDFNKEFKYLKADLKGYYLSKTYITKFDKPTRKCLENKETKYSNLDFFVVSPKIKICDSKVLDQDDISDHYPIHALVYIN